MSAASTSTDREAAYYSVLAAAISQIKHDSFQARGAVYDRLWQSHLKRLRADGAYSEEDIVGERASFCSAVQKIEFGESQAQQPVGRRVVPRTASRPARRHFFWPLAVRMASACAVLVIVGLAYGLVAVRLDSAAATALANESASDSWRSPMMRAILSISNLIEQGSFEPPANGQRAVLYAESKTNAAGIPHVGRAVWRAQRNAGAAANSGPAMSIDVDIPQKDLAVRISFRPETGRDAVMTHFVELRFYGANRALTDAVAEVVGVLLKNDELSRGLELVGKIVRVQPGVFLMGLSGTQADARRNLMVLRDRNWLDIPIVYKDGSRSILTIEKGETGQRAVNAMLAARGES